MKNFFIFDMDDTICETSLSVHATVESQILKHYCNVDVLPEEISSRFAGLPTKRVFEEFSPGCDSEFLRGKKWEFVYKMMETKSVKCLPLMHELIVYLHRSGNCIAVASASPPLWIETCLKRAVPFEQITNFTLLSDIFNVTISAESCPNPKPAPDVFLKAESLLIEKYGNDFGQTYVIGDGISDVLGGIAAKMNVLYLSNNNKMFDSNNLVRRFRNSKELCNFVIENLC